MPPISSVLFDSSLTLPQSDLNRVLRDESVAYTPTTLERGTKQYTLPAELLKFSVYNLVDMENICAGSSTAVAEDKEILMPIEELERKLNVTGVKSETPVSTPSSTVPKTNNTPKFSRPDVTWLRRTEYISSVRNNPNNSAISGNPDQDAKALLGEAVKFKEIVEEVTGTFEKAKEARHPLKPQVELAQSYPIVLDDSASLIHGLIMGDSTATEGSILQIDVDSEAGVTLFNRNTNDTLKSSGSFDVQRTTEPSSKSFIVMLPAGAGQDAFLSKVASTFSLRKRRTATKQGGGAKNLKTKVMKITRQ